MSDWWHLAQVSAPALGSAVACIGLRRYLRAMLWNLLLKGMGVDADERRQIAVKAARLDLAVQKKRRRGRRRRQGAAAPSDHSSRALRVRGL